MCLTMRIVIATLATHPRIAGIFWAKDKDGSIEDGAPRLSAQHHHRLRAASGAAIRGPAVRCLKACTASMSLRAGTRAARKREESRRLLGGTTSASKLHTRIR